MSLPREAALFLIACFGLTMVFAPSGYVVAAPQAHPETERIEAAMRRSMDDDAQLSTQLAGCMRGRETSTAATECLDEAFFASDPADGKPLGLYPTLVEASRHSLLLKARIQQGLARAPRTQAGLRSVFRDACAAFAGEAERDAAAREHHRTLCADQDGSDGRPATSSTWNQAERQLSLCETAQQRMNLPEKICADAFRSRLDRLASREMSRLGDPAPTASMTAPRTLARGGYSDGTLDEGEGRFDPVILACKNQSSLSQRYKLDARAATDCIFRAPIFSEAQSSNHESILRIAEQLNGRDEATARNSAVQTFLLQLRALAARLAADALRREQGATGAGAQAFELPASCRDEQRGDRGFIAQAIQASPIRPEPDPTGQGLVEAATAADALYQRIWSIELECQGRANRGGDTSPAAIGAPMLNHCSGEAGRPMRDEARVLKAAYDRLLATHPTLLLDPREGRATTKATEPFRVLEGAPLLRLPAARDILRAPEGPARLAAAQRIRAQNIARMRTYLADICDPSKVRTLELLRNPRLTGMLLAQPGAGAAMLQDFVGCAARGPAPSDGISAFLAPIAVCGGATAAASAVATPFVGIAVGAGCGLAEAARAQVPEYLRALDDAHAKMDGLAAGTVSAAEAEASLVALQQNLNGLVTTGVLTALDLGALAKSLRLSKGLPRAKATVAGRGERATVTSETLAARGGGAPPPAIVPNGDEPVFVYKDMAKGKPVKITASILRANQTKYREALEKMDIKYHELPPDYLSYFGHSSGMQLEDLSEQTLKSYNDAKRIPRLLHIDLDSLPASGRAHPMELAMKHPEFPHYLEVLRKNRRFVAVDSSLENSGSEAYYSWGHNVIGIRPTTTWKSFLHEYEHFLFDDQIRQKMGFESLETIARNAPEETKKIIAQGRMPGKAMRLIQSGLPQRAVDETLAVQAELDALKRAGFSRFSSLSRETRDYALFHQIRELNAIPAAQRTAVQRRTLVRAMAERYLLTHPFAQVGHVSVAALASGIAGARLVSESYSYYSEDLGQLAVKIQGQWRSFSVDDIAEKLTDRDVEEYGRFLPPPAPSQTAPAAGR